MRHWIVSVKYSKSYTVSIEVLANDLVSAFSFGLDQLLKEGRTVVGRRLKSANSGKMLPKYSVQEIK